ncbi:MAG: tetratricopeptide repeat protein [Candidatus Methylomirabilales bacterium]
MAASRPSPRRRCPLLPTVAVLALTLVSPLAAEDLPPSAEARAAAAPPSRLDAGQAALRAGIRLLGESRHAAAEAAFREAVRLRPGAEAWRAIANAYLAEGQLAHAIVALRGMEAASPDPLIVRIREALALALEGRSADAVPALVSIAPLSPNAGLQALLGAQLEALGKTRDAIEAYREAVRLSPEEPRHWLRLAAAYERVGQCAHAVQAYEQAGRLRPDPRAWVGLGRLLHHEREYKAAVQAFRQAVALRPTDLDALAGLILAYGGAREWAASLDTYHLMKRLDRQGAEEAFAAVFGQKK